MTKSGDKHSNGTVAHNGNGLKHRASASTLNSSQVGSSTPSTTPATSTTDEVNTQTKDFTNGPTPVPPVPSRPQRPTTEPVKRYSMNVWIYPPTMASSSNLCNQGLASPAPTGSNGSFNRASFLAPRVLSVSDNSWVRMTGYASWAMLTMPRYINKCCWFSARSARRKANRWTAH